MPIYQTNIYTSETKDPRMTKIFTGFSYFCLFILSDVCLNSNLIDLLGAKNYSLKYKFWCFFSFLSL